MRVIALIAAHNEARFIGGCVEHLARQGVQVYLLDNESTDATAAIAKRYLGRGIIGMETIPRDGVHRLEAILRRKEALARELAADWFMHADADEIRLPPSSRQTLSGAFAEAQAAGYNAVNFLEFTFVPTHEAPDHDHPRFQETMRWYYPFLPDFPHRLNAWRKPCGTGMAWRMPFARRRHARLVQSGGHRVQFAGLRMYPVSFPMKHYLFLSPAHAVEKYARRMHSARGPGARWHGWRAKATGAERSGPAAVPLPRAAELRCYASDDTFDATAPLSRHIWAERWVEQLKQGAVRMPAAIQDHGSGGGGD